MISNKYYLWVFRFIWEMGNPLIHGEIPALGRSGGGALASTCVARQSPSGPVVPWEPVEPTRMVP